MGEVELHHLRKECFDTPEMNLAGASNQADGGKRHHLFKSARKEIQQQLKL
jgi:hypothetical protein